MMLITVIFQQSPDLAAKVPLFILYVSVVLSHHQLATLTYKLLHNQAPSYLGPLVHVVDVPGHRFLRSANTDRLMVLHVRLSSIGKRAFPVAAPCV